MVYAALTLQLTFLLTAFALRTLLHLRRTGSIGFRAGAQRSPAELLGAGGITTATLLSAGGVALDLFDIGSRIEFLETPVLSVLGVGLAIGGIALVLRAQGDMGASWRIGVDQAERTDLVTGGLFRWTRNPIFLGMLLFWLGTAAMIPNPATLLAATLAVMSIEVQVRLVEEPYLLRTHGDAYHAYASRTGRLLPGLGKLR